MTSSRKPLSANRAPEQLSSGARSASALLYDSEALLRQVDTLLDEIRETGDSSHDGRRASLRLEQSPPTPREKADESQHRGGTYAGLVGALAQVRKGRSALDRATPSETMASRLDAAEHVLRDTEHRLVQLTRMMERGTGEQRAIQ
ncbi:MAG: hypothetical protein M3081_19260 [Gemmatimonadota bacterium]|nr:hypothetical protein [Gemmatimonadota bacterium]